MQTASGGLAAPTLPRHDNGGTVSALKPPLPFSTCRAVIQHILGREDRFTRAELGQSNPQEVRSLIDAAESCLMEGAGREQFENFQSRLAVFLDHFIVAEVTDYVTVRSKRQTFAQAIVEAKPNAISVERAASTAAVQHRPAPSQKAVFYAALRNVLELVIAQSKSGMGENNSVERDLKRAMARLTTKTKGRHGRSRRFMDASVVQIYCQSR